MSEVSAALELPSAGRRSSAPLSLCACSASRSEIVQLHTASYPARLVRGTPIAKDEKVAGGIYRRVYRGRHHPGHGERKGRGARPATDSGRPSCGHAG